MTEREEKRGARHSRLEGDKVITIFCRFALRGLYPYIKFDNALCKGVTKQNKVCTMEDKKPTLFISYCQKDGNTYADDLETELVDYFEVKRDKSKLIPNDDIYDFMAGIADEDYVIIVLTSEYVKSRNCMLEMAYLASQDDWPQKTMVLVIDESIYSTGRKLEILTYWSLMQQKTNLIIDDDCSGKELMGQDMEYLNTINSKLEEFLLGISRRLNPSQIAIVNEMVRKLKNRSVAPNPTITKGEQAVKEFLIKNGSKTIKEISEETGYSMAVASRLVRRLIENNEIKSEGNYRQKRYSV